jgi:hypothetical protein
MQPDTDYEYLAGTYATINGVLYYVSQVEGEGDEQVLIAFDTADVRHQILASAITAVSA